LFLDTKIDECKTQEVFTNILKSKENIVLVGMPSSGKSTVGKILAEKLGRDFYDLDDEIEAKIGCTIAEYFEDHSERDFRDIETEVTKEISQKNGIVIATGGGCILRGENVSALRSNGRLYFLDRSLNSLIPTNSRPLASNRLAIENLYRLRYDIYKTLSDVRIDGDLAPELVSELIRKEFLK
jgi:shikimate dehydrogenase